MRCRMRAAALVALVLAVAFGAARPTAAAGGPFALERSSRALLVTGIIKESTEGVKSRGDTIAEHQKVVEEEITAVVKEQEAVEKAILQIKGQANGPKEVVDDLVKATIELENATATLGKMELITKGDEQSLLRSAEGAAPGQALPSPETSTSFWVGTYRSFLVILFLEIGDRTFFIAALLSMKSPHRLVFAGAWGALFVMTAISCALGVAAPLLMPRSLTHWAGAVLFVGFGVQLLWKAYNMKAVEGTAEELEEVEGELKETDARVRYAQFAKFVDPIVVQAFVMTFLAEWGDRSQIATITMAADYNPWGITLGGSVGHACATAGAVVGGRLLATRINERTVAICGGLCFLLFGLLAILEDPSIDYSSAVPALFGRGGGGSEAEELADAELAAAEVAAAAQAAEAAAEALNATAKAVVNATRRLF